MGNPAKLAFLLAILTMTGCAGSSKLMQTVPPDRANYMPDATHALVVFLRPSGLGFVVQSSVFDATTNENKLIGVVSAKKKVAFLTPPGEKLFMVIGESADFAKAELDAGKTYYVLVTPRMGVWKARFSLEPVTRERTDSTEFAEWLSECVYYENTPDSFKWAEENAPSIEDKRKEYYKDWMEKPESERPLVRREYGR